MDIYILAWVMEARPATHSGMGNRWIPCSERYCESMSIRQSLMPFRRIIHSEMKSGLMDCAIPGVYRLIETQAIYISEMWARGNGRKLIFFQRALQAAPTLAGIYAKARMTMMAVVLVI